MSKKRLARWGFRVAVYGTLTLVIACAFFLRRGQQRLLDLLSHTGQKATEVYSQAPVLRSDSSQTLDSVRMTLDVLGYQPVTDHLARPGQYQLQSSTIDMWTRGFDFPDQSLPATQIRLSFSNQKLDRIDTLGDNRTSASWRLEPKRLARWASKGGASQPQVHLEELPPYVSQAVLAVEDKRFFHHGAIDLRGLLRAVWIDLRRGQLKQGGSTISQQLSRSIFLDIQRTWSRKILEAGLAFYLEAFYSKPQLLEMYLNQVYWGQDGPDSLIGLESASESFFGKRARDLTLGESALLAGLLQSPNHYSPRADPVIARQRRNLVLALMQGQKLITPEQFSAALKEPFKLAPLGARAGEAPYFIATLQEMLLQKYSLAVLMTQGWRIYATIDPVLQAQATAALHPSEGQGALVALDPETGAVRAWVGGTNYGASTFDRVVYAKRQPGSAFKPFVVLSALELHKATEATLLDDKPLTVKTPQGSWSPQNYDRKYRGPVTLWDTLVYSLNVPSVRLAMLTGLDSIVDIAHRVGIQSPLRAVPSLALGTSEVTVLELTSAYATLAHGGRYSAPYTIETIFDSDQHVVELHVSQEQVAVSDVSAYLVTQMLQAVFNEGTAKSARALGFTYPAAGKTGTSENYQDAWFMGYTPHLVCGVWVGYDQPHTLGHAAAGIALPIWVSFMQKVVASEPEQKFAEPQGLVWKTIDTDSGELARSGCLHRKKEAFLPGTAPDKFCTLHPGGIYGFFYRWKKESASSPATK